MSKFISITERSSISKSIEDVWEVCALDFEHIDRWDANIKQSVSMADDILDAKLGGRICHQYNGSKTIEQFSEYDAKEKTFTYAIISGLPGFVVHAQNTWELSEMSNRETQLTMTVLIEVKGILGVLMSGMMKNQMSKVLRNAQEELKHFIEHGSPHHRKQKKLK